MSTPKQSLHEEYFNNPSNLELESGLFVLKAGRYPHFDRRVGPRSVEFYSIHFVASGKVTLGWDGQWVTLSAGDLFCLFPGSVYIYYAETNQPPTQLMWFALQGTRSLQALERIGLTPELPFRKHAVLPSSLELVDRAIEILQQHRFQADLELLAIMHQLLLTLEPIKERVPLSTDSPLHPNWLESLPRYMKLHCTEHVTVDDLAQWANVHRSHLTRAFTRRYGVSPSRYMLHLVMEKASRLLATGRLSVTETALSVGYSDLFTFSRAFTRYFGQTPTEYRERHLSSE